MKIYILTEVFKGYSTIKVVEAEISNTNGRFYAYPTDSIIADTDSSFYEEFEFATSLEEAKTKIERFCSFKARMARLKADDYEFLANKPMQDFEFV